MPIVLKENVFGRARVVEARVLQERSVLGQKTLKRRRAGLLAADVQERAFDHRVPQAPKLRQQEAYVKLPVLGAASYSLPISNEIFPG